MSKYRINILISSDIDLSNRFTTLYTYVYEFLENIFCCSRDDITINTFTTDIIDNIIAKPVKGDMNISLIDSDKRLKHPERFVPDVNIFVHKYHFEFLEECRKKHGSCIIYSYN